jgi:N-acetylneuraminic acid mutarotase
VIRMSALCGGFSRSTQHLLILPDGEVSDGVACTDMVLAEAASRALGALEER